MARKAKAGRRTPIEGVPGYDAEPQRTKRELVFRHYEYELPFNYPNVEVVREYHGGESHGMELIDNPKTDAGKGPLGEAPEHIVITEDDPIVRVVVIGSACTPPGYVKVECEPTEDFHRPDVVPGVLATRFRIDGLWGMHLRYDQWAARTTGDIGYGELPEGVLARWPWMKDIALKSHYREHPHVGMSCAVFEIPRSRRVRISGGSVLAGWHEDDGKGDNQYSFRVIRTTVAVQT
ncbi:MAG: hypothetical protein V2A58_14350 [Planctomycetota bacterium]